MPSGRSVRRYVPVVVGTVLMLVCAVFIAKTLASDWNEVSDKLANASLGWLGFALVMSVVGMVVVACTWADALRVVGGRMTRRQACSWYFVGELGKYLPGAIWAAVGRGEVARRNGVPRNRAYPSVAMSLIGLYLAAALLAAVLVPFDLAHQTDSGPALLLLGLVPVGLGCLHPAVLGRLRDLVARLTRKEIDVVVPTWGQTVGLLLRYVPAWVGIASATWATAMALPGVDAPLLRIALATLLSWTAGFVTPTPAGAGVREAVFIAVSGLAAGPAVAVAVTSRLLFVVVDVVGAVVGIPGSRPRSADTGSVGLGAPDASEGARA